MNEDEKRSNTRRKIHIPILCWDVEDVDRTKKGKKIVSMDLSSSGLGFYSTEMYSLDTLWYIEIYLPSQKIPISCKLKIVSVKVGLRGEDYLIGGEFFDLNSDDRLKLSSSIDKLDLYALLESAVAGGASDIHLTIGKPPKVRRQGRILTMAGDIIEPGQVEAMLFPLMTSKQIAFFEENKEMDFAFSPDINSRFRVNLHSQKGYIEAVLRTIPTNIKTFEELGMPIEEMQNFCQQKSGLILICGTTGAGKTTTMMAMVDYINRTKECVVMTVEDPIEYTFKSELSIIKQRELGSDTRSYAEALKRVLRQDPDVICVGELLDGECLMAAMRAAETGHLVISTVHSPDTVAAIERMVNFFPPEHAGHVRQQLSSCLLGILFQILVQSKQTGGRVVATELLLNNSALKNLIREGRFNLMGNVLQTGRTQGMHTLKDSINDLVGKGLIDEQEAAEAATASTDFTKEKDQP